MNAHLLELDAKEASDLEHYLVVRGLLVLCLRTDRHDVDTAGKATLDGMIETGHRSETERALSGSPRVAIEPFQAFELPRSWTKHHERYQGRDHQGSDSSELEHQKTPGRSQSDHIGC